VVEAKQVFLSYAHQDARAADQVEDWLAGGGLSCWRDPQLEAGRFPEQIEAAIRGCQVFLVLISASSVRSTWVQDELGLARMHRRVVVPIVIDGTDVDALSGVWAFLTATTQIFTLHRSTDPSMKRLLNTLRQVAEDHKTGSAESSPSGPPTSSGAPSGAGGVAAPDCGTAPAEVSTSASISVRPAARPQKGPTARAAAPMLVNRGTRGEALRALLAAILAPGLGHVIVGQAQRGFRFYGLLYLLTFVMQFVIMRLDAPPYNVIVPAMIVAGVYLGGLVDTWKTTRRRGRVRKRYNLWFVHVALFLVPSVIFVVSRGSYARGYRMGGIGMENTFTLGDFFLVENSAYCLRTPFSTRPASRVQSPKRGEIVMFHTTSGDWVSRCVAVAGDAVAVKDGKLMINGVAAIDPATIKYADQTASADRLNSGPIRVSDHAIYAMADDRQNGYKGEVNLDDLTGRVRSIYFSWDSNRHLPRWERIGLLVGRPR
jgi:signal peptidase I